MTRFIITTAVLAAMLSGCGEDEDRPNAVRADTADRYCALTRQMDAAGTKFSARLERRENGTAKDFEAAERRFVARSAPQFEEIERVAPAAIRADVQLLLLGQRARAGLGDAVDEKEVGAAERRIRRYERRRCG